MLGILQSRPPPRRYRQDRKSTRLNSSHGYISYAVFCLKKKTQSQVVYQYLVYGKIQAIHGANPFVVNPNRFWADASFPWMRWITQPSVYGPAWILLSFSVAKVIGSHLTLAFATLKLVILALDIAVMAMIVALGRDRPDPERAAGWGLLAFAWNPLVLITVPLAGSAAIGIVAAFLGAILARRRGRDGLATVLLTLAA